MLIAGWSEYVKNGGTRRSPRCAATELGGQGEFGWRTWDLGGVLRRWGRHVPPERVHVLPVPRAGSRRTTSTGATSPRCSGSTRTAYDAPDEPRNPALGVGPGRAAAPDQPAPQRVPQAGGPRHLDPRLPRRAAAGPPGRRAASGADDDQLAECRRRADRAVQIDRASAATTWSGDVERLRVPAERRGALAPRRGVGCGDLVESATTLVADMLSDIRRLQPRRSADMTQGADFPAHDAGRRHEERLIG